MRWHFGYLLRYQLTFRKGRNDEYNLSVLQEMLRVAALPEPDFIESVLYIA